MNKMNSFAWLCLLLSARIWLPCFANESSVSRSRDLLIPTDHLPSLLDSEEDHGRTSTKQAAMKANEDGERRKLTASENITLTEKAAGKGAGGKGTGGTNNVVHQRPGEKNAASALFYMPYFAVSFIIPGFSFSMLLAFPLPLF